MATRRCGGRSDGDWLEFTADLLCRPLRELPIERVAAMLRETFDAVAVADNEWRPDGTVRGEILPVGAELPGPRAALVAWGERNAHQHPIARYYRATGDIRPMRTTDVPTRFADGRGFGEGALLLRECCVGEQLAFPIGSGAAPRTLVVGRPEPFRAAELALAERVWWLLRGLDRQAHAYASAVSPSGPAPTVAGRVTLTPRESTVLGLLAEGHTAAAIGRRLDIAERTVHKHLERCYAKLGVADRLTAVLRAQRLGLVAA